jgi:quinol monooxygenase YgiN
VEAFLKSALPLVDAEPETTAWFAARVDASTFLIFDVFPSEAGRAAHLAGPVAEALGARAGELLSEAPVIERIEILASKLPG